MDKSEWEDAKNYDYTKSHTDEQWGWEFLRRNPKYKKDWEAALTRYLEEKKMPLQARPVKSEYYYNWSKDYLNIPLRSGDNVFEKWGIPYYINPINESPAAYVFDLLVPPYLLMGNKHPLYTQMEVTPDSNLKDTQLAILIDLSRPVIPQLDEAKKCLLLLKKLPLIKNTRPKKNRELWVMYLRMLDATIAGATRKKALPIIFTKKADCTSESIWNERLKQAKTMTVSGYRSLMLKPTYKLMLKAGA
jgi:hypothetical protein